jgi:uncharacterized membrane protein
MRITVENSGKVTFALALGIIAGMFAFLIWAFEKVLIPPGLNVQEFPSERLVSA